MLKPDQELFIKYYQAVIGSEQLEAIPNGGGRNVKSQDGIQMSRDKKHMMSQ